MNDHDKAAGTPATPEGIGTAMMSIRIFKGFVLDFDNGSNGIGAGFGSGVSTFAVGDPPVTFWSPFSFGGMPIAPGDYVAVAGMRSLVPGVGQVALAYRRLGTSGAAHFFNPVFPMLCILFGAIGVFGGLFLGPLNADTGSLAAGLIVSGLFGIWRLWSMTTACQMLSKLELPISTYRHGQ